MRPPRDPNRMPSLLPFIVMAVVLIVIYAGVLVFPTIRNLVSQQDCIGTGRTNC